MNKKTILTLGGTSLVLGAIFAIPTAVNAYRGDSGTFGHNHTEEREQKMTQAFENGDYQAWKEQMQGKGRITEVVDEGNFYRFAEARQLSLEGKNDEAQKIRAELGLGLRDGSGQGKGQGTGYRGGK